MVIVRLSGAVTNVASRELASMTTVSLRILFTIPKSLSAKLSAAPCTFTFALAANTTAALPRASEPMVMVCVVAESVKLFTVTLPMLPSLFKPTVALANDKDVTECGILTTMLGSSKRVSKKPLVGAASMLADSTAAGLNVQSLTLPGSLAVVPFAATARSTSTVMVLVSVAPWLSVTLISNFQLPVGS